jgi:hypothetical protein
MESFETRIASDFVQEHLPNLDCENIHTKFTEYNNQFPLDYPRSEEHVIDYLLIIGLSLTKHEKYADIWRRQVIVPSI